MYNFRISDVLAFSKDKDDLKFFYVKLETKDLFAKDEYVLLN